MARLPIPGSDDGAWGQILNEYLEVEHNPDGTHNFGLNDLNNVDIVDATDDDVLQRKGGTWTSRTPEQFKSDLVLVKSDVGLSDVNNTSDLAKPISTDAQTALDAKANQSVTVSGGTSLAGGGDLTTDRTLTLVNDSAAPGNDQYYGTDAAGTKGYHAIPDLDGYVQGDGIAKVTVNATAPPSPSVGDVWIST